MTPAGPPPTHPAADRGHAAPSRRTLWLVGGIALAGILLGLVLVVVLLPRWLHSPAGGSASASSGGAAEARKIHATLFYVSEDGGLLVPVNREVTFGATPGEQARHLIEAQLAPAPEGQLSAIPAGVKVLAVYLDSSGGAFVDLSRDIITGHPGGSLAEALTVFSLVNVLTSNLPDVSGVQILVEGKAVDTLAGHIDLGHPLGRSLRWVRRGP